MCNLYNKVKDKQILLNFLNYTSLKVYFIKKGTVVGRHKGAFFQKKKVTVLIKRLCVYLCKFFF